MPKAFEIYSVAGFTTGRLALCRQPVSAGEFEQVSKWNADVIVTMTDLEEFPNETFASDIARCSPQWIHAAVPDFGVPKGDMSPLLERLGQALSDGARVLIHCKGGQGRSGMLVTRLLVDQGEPANEALHRVRAVRPHAVETKDQELWASLKPKQPA